MYASVIVWTYAPAALGDVRGYVQEAVLPLVRAQPGFRNYYALRTGRDAYITILIHDTQSNAEAAHRQLLPVLRRYQGELVEGMNRYAGEVEAAASLAAP
jgi:hypothetical protein